MSGKDAPRGATPTVTEESLLAELAMARRSGAVQQVVSIAEPEPRRKSGSAFIYGAVALALFAGFVMSPLRNRVPGAERMADQFEQFLARYVVLIK